MSSSEYQEAPLKRTPLPRVRRSRYQGNRNANDLDEVITLEREIACLEWIPFRSNQIVCLNEKPVRSTVAKAVFTSMVDTVHKHKFRRTDTTHPGQYSGL